MEILAVLLVIAVIASFAVPLVKSVREEMRYQKAKAAGVQLAEAVRSFYTDSKGCFDLSSSFHAADATGGTCPSNNPIKTGIPSCSESDKAKLGDIFACGYLSPKMFVDLPYTFTVSDPRSSEDEVFIRGDESGTERWFIVKRDMTIKEDEEEEQ